MTTTSVWISCEDLLPEAGTLVEARFQSLPPRRMVRQWGTFWTLQSGEVPSLRPTFWRPLQTEEVSA